MAGLLADQLVMWRRISIALNAWERDFDESKKAAWKCAREANSDISIWRAADAGCIPPLLHLLTSKDEQANKAAAESLMQLIAPMEDGSPSSAVPFLVKAGAVAPLVKILTEGYREGGKVVHLTAEVLIGLSGSPHAREDIIATDVVSMALKALEEYVTAKLAEAEEGMPRDAAAGQDKTQGSNGGARGPSLGRSFSAATAPTGRSFSPGGERASQGGAAMASLHSLAPLTEPEEYEEDESGSEGDSEEAEEDAMVREAHLRQVPYDRRMSVSQRAEAAAAAAAALSPRAAGRVSSNMALLLVTLLASLSSSDAVKSSVRGPGMGILVRMVQCIAGIKPNAVGADYSHVFFHGTFAMYTMATIAQLVDGPADVAEENVRSLLEGDLSTLPMLLGMLNSPRVMRMVRSTLMFTIFKIASFPGARVPLLRHGAAEKVTRYLHTTGAGEGCHIAAVCMTHLNAAGVWAIDPKSSKAMETAAKVVGVIIKGMQVRLTTEMPEMLLDVLDYALALRTAACSADLAPLVADGGGVRVACHVLAQCRWGTTIFGNLARSSMAMDFGGAASGPRISERKKLELARSSRRPLVAPDPNCEEESHIEAHISLEAFTLLWLLMFDPSTHDTMAREGAVDLLECVEREVAASLLFGRQRPLAGEVRRTAAAALLVMEGYTVREPSSSMQAFAEGGAGAGAEAGATEGAGAGAQVLLCVGEGARAALQPLQDRLLQAGVTTWMSGKPLLALRAQMDVLNSARALVLAVAASTRNSPDCRMELEVCRRAGKNVVVVQAEHGYSPDSWLAAAASGLKFFDLRGDGGEAGQERALEAVLAEINRAGVTLSPRGSFTRGHLPHIEGRPVPGDDPAMGRAPLDRGTPPAHQGSGSPGASRDEAVGAPPPRSADLMIAGNADPDARVSVLGEGSVPEGRAGAAGRGTAGDLVIVKKGGGFLSRFCTVM